MERPTDKSSAAKNTSNAQRHYRLSRGDLPLRCPLPDMSLWNSHPRVYLPIEKTGTAKCPYCGTDFTLEET